MHSVTKPWRKYAAAHIALALTLERYVVTESEVCGDLVLSALTTDPHTLSTKTKFLVHIQDKGEQTPEPNPYTTVYYARVSEDLNHLEVSEELLKQLPELQSFSRLNVIGV